MKSQFILLAFFVIVVSSCSTSYKTGQTPDDVYFSPPPPQDEYVSNKDNDDRKYKGENPDSYQDYDNRYLRMKVQNRTRWSELDDWYQYDIMPSVIIHLITITHPGVPTRTGTIITIPIAQDQ